MRILFLVQGEGRGHLTQAISLGQILRGAGHKVVGAMVGTSPGRNIPSFFHEQIFAPVHHFAAPNIIYKAHGGGMNVGRTIAKHLAHLPKYLKSLHRIHETVRQINPDLIVSFYDTYGGLYNTIYRSGIPMICIAHQYLLLHPKFVFPENSRLNRFLINLNSKSTSWLSAKRLALSFREIPSAPELKISVLPPLLRKEVTRLTPQNGAFILVYMTHHSLSKQVINWHLKHQEVELHCFWDNPDASEEFTFDSTLTFHQINSEKYLRMLATCRALVTTAGFESVCEAMYLGKPVMMVPVPNHFEQECNAIDGVISGAGVMSRSFDLSVIFDYLPKHIDQSAKFRAWYNCGQEMFVKEIGEFEKSIDMRRKMQSEI
ncbi:glycosyltransferase family protein [Dyadobacter fermentans]|uniref:Putative glycosyltransferase n=1 Tax=Dyadobacter fermentans (strain ATCC 700827 / DSM 18053 / CIP 107007 / KCTC 52180 / NS114) TaxID=471854 RepID=C6VV42_DYAFD|nr:glycosyltransferase family protein [Dyadobacter fermentans]ACT94865.1 putative glycosyltransferase [Dyadobacter fermentans DSM 18053]